MSNTEPRPKAPDYLEGYSDDERAAARQAQTDIAAEKTGKSPKRTIRRAIAGIAAGAVVVGGGAAVYKGVTGGKNTAERTSTSAPVNPSEDPTSANTPEETGAPEVESSLSDYGVSVAENPTFDLAAQAYFVKLGEYLASASDTYDQPGDPERLNALLGEDWESNPELDDYGFSLQESSKTISTNHFATGENGSTEYEYNINVESVEDVEESDDQIAGLVTIHVTDNIMDTLLAMNNEANLDSTGQHHFTLSNVDGYWQVVEFDNLNNN